MERLKIHLAFRDQSSREEIQIGNLFMTKYYDFDYCCFIYYADNTTTIKDIYDCAIKIINQHDQNFINKYFIPNCNEMFTFGFQNLSCSIAQIIEKEDVPILNLLKYLDMGLEFRLSNSIYGLGAAYCIEKGIKFYTHSNEENHKGCPHIHTTYKNKDSTYSIHTGKKMVGEPYPAKIEKYIENKIINNQQQLIKFWNDTTNGLYFKTPPFPISQV